MGNYFCVLTVCEVTVHSRRFVKAFLHAGDADIQDYTPAQNVFIGVGLRTIYYYYYGERDIYTETPCSADTGFILSRI